MRKPILSTLFFLLAFGQIFSQKAPMKWGKVPAEDLAMTTYEADPGAGAVVLCDYGSIKFTYDHAGMGYEFNRHKRIKILNRSGFDVADVFIPYYVSQGFSNFKAQIFAPDGSKVEVDKKEVFDEEVTKYYNRKRFTFPNVQEGSVIEFRYMIKSGNLFSLREWFFQESIPVRQSELRYEMLSYFHYSTVMRGGLAPIVNEESTGSETIRGGGSVPTVHKRWVLENVPAMKKEPFTACDDDYRSKMTFQLLSTNIPGQFSEKIEWPQIAKSLQESDDFGRQYLKKGTSRKVVEAAAPALSAADSPLEKAQAAYRFVNEKMKWNGYHWYDAFDDMDKIFIEGAGYSGELNLMLLALLRQNDIVAFPVVISTRSNGKPNPYYPLLSQFDHTVVKAMIDGNEYWLDVGDPMRPFGLLGEESLNGQGLLINDEAGVFGWVDIKPKKAADVIYTTADVSEDGTLTANVKLSHSSYSALDERMACAGGDGKKLWQERLSEKYPDAEVNDIKMENMKNLGEKLKGEMNVSLPDAAMVSGDLMYLSPTVYTSFSENPFKAEGRTLPVEFAYPFSEQVITQLNMPEGYLVDGLPESIRVALPEGAGNFSYRVSESVGKVQITSKLELNKTFFLPEEYDGLRNFFSLVEEKMGEQVVLKKQT